MAAKYKIKPKKAVAKRFRVTGTGKLKHQRRFTRHLLSGRSGDMLRRLNRPGVLDESDAKEFRRILGVKKNPAKIRHLRAMKAAQAEKAEGASGNKGASGNSDASK